MLDLIVKVIRAQQGEQEELTDAQLEALGRRLVAGELRSAQALLLLAQQAQRGDVRSVSTTMDYLVALGMDGRAALNIAANFFLDRRHYDEAQRYAQTLCYDHDRYGSSLRLLAILDTLNGDYTTALMHFDEYLERNRSDVEVEWFRFDALVRSGALTPALELGRATAIRPQMTEFLERRRAGKGFHRFSWHGTPTRSGQIFEGYDLYDMRRYLAGVLKTPLRRDVPDLPTLDLLINSGVYVPDRRQFGRPDVWTSPAVFEITLAGDCEDFALWAWVNLCRLGYPARFTIGGLYEEEPNHAWVTIHRGQSVQVLECTPQGFNPPIGARRAIEYRPWWSVDRNLHYYRH